MKKIFLLTLLLILLNGCIKIGYSQKEVKQSVVKAEKIQDKIEKEVKPPVKPWKMIQSEIDILAMVANDLETAKNQYNRIELEGILKLALEKVRVLQSSVGLSPENIKGLSPRQINRKVNKYRISTTKFKKREYLYKQKMRDFVLHASDMQDVVKEKDGIIAQLTFWLFIAIGASVLIAAFVPGGGLLVKRFWTGAFKTAHMFGKQAYGTLQQTVKGLNNAMDKNKQIFDKKDGDGRTLRQIINDEIDIELTDKTIYNGVVKGDNHWKEFEKLWYFSSQCTYPSSYRSSFSHK